MNLKVYLATHDLKVKDFCNMLECTRSYFSRVKNNHVIPSKRFAKDVERLTNGEVKAEELLKIKEQ